MRIAKALKALTKVDSRDKDADCTQVITKGVGVDPASLQAAKARLGADREKPRTLPRVRCTDCMHHRQKRNQAYCTAAHMNMSGTSQERQCLYFEARQM